MQDGIRSHAHTLERCCSTTELPANLPRCAAPDVPILSDQNAPHRISFTMRGYLSVLHAELRGLNTTSLRSNHTDPFEPTWPTHPNTMPELRRQALLQDTSVPSPSPIPCRRSATTSSDRHPLHCQTPSAAASNHLTTLGHQLLTVTSSASNPCPGYLLSAFVIPARHQMAPHCRSAHLPPEWKRTSQC